MCLYSAQLLPFSDGDSVLRCRDEVSSASSTLITIFTSNQRYHFHKKSDLITDLYIKELKAYQAPPVKASDSVGQVKPWSAPSAPAIPAVEAAAEADLAEYDSQAVEVEGIAETTESEAPTESLDDWFVVEAIEDAHH